MKKFKKIFIFCIFTMCTAMIFAGCDLVNGITPSIILSSNFNTEYALNEELDLTGGKITYVDKNGDMLIVEISSSMISGFDTTTVTNPKRELTVSYECCTTTVEYTVIEPVMLTLGDLYYIAPPSPIMYIAGGYKLDGNGVGMYEYLFLSSPTTICYGLNSKAPKDFNIETDTSVGFSEYQFTTKLVDKKMTYQFETSYANSQTETNNVKFIITIEDENSIALVVQQITTQPDVFQGEGLIQASYSITKYSAEYDDEADEQNLQISVGDLYYFNDGFSDIYIYFALIDSKTLFMLTSDFVPGDFDFNNIDIYLESGNFECYEYVVEYKDNNAIFTISPLGESGGTMLMINVISESEIIIPLYETNTIFTKYISNN